MFIQDSRRSYRTYTYTTEFTLVRRYPKVSPRLRNVYRYCGTYSYTKVLVSTTELILILRSIYWSYSTWTCISDLIHVLQSVYLSYRPILILQNLYLFGTYTYNRLMFTRDSRRSYRADSYSELILIFLIREYP